MLVIYVDIIFSYFGEICDFMMVVLIEVNLLEFIVVLDDVVL